MTAVALSRRTHLGALGTNGQVLLVLGELHPLFLRGEAEYRVVQDDLVLLGEPGELLEDGAAAHRVKSEHGDDVDRACSHVHASDAVVAHTPSNGASVDLVAGRSHFHDLPVEISGNSGIFT